MKDKVSGFWTRCRELASKAGARGMMSYAGDESPLFGDLADYILSICMWDPFMSREEYDAKVNEAIRLLYGEEVEAINTLLKIYENARNFTPCHVYDQIEMTDTAYLAGRADEIERLCDIALSGCESDEQQRDVEAFVSVFLYGVLVGTRDSDFVNGDAASRAVYAARYERCAGYIARRGLTIGDLAPQ